MLTVRRKPGAGGKGVPSQGPREGEACVSAEPERKSEATVWPSVPGEGAPLSPANPRMYPRR